VSAKTFPRGGIHPPEHKEPTAGTPIREIPLAAELIIPLLQHLGAPCEPLVSVGDRVLAGQKIGDCQAFISAPIHSPVSGTVTAIEKRRGFTGSDVLCVVIAVEKTQESVPPIERRDWRTVEIDEIRSIVRQAGIVGLGGAAFPASVKITPPKDKPIDSVIINGCECEPFLTCDEALMLKRPDDLIEATEMLLRVVGAKRGFIGIETNKPSAIQMLKEKLQGHPNVEVVPCEVKYPEGAEKQLIKAVLNREVPPGKLPSEVGALVQNVGSVLAMLDAVAEGTPLTKRVLTVTGAVAKPGNLEVPIGTPVSYLIEQCGGFAGDPGKVILGGPMTGWAIDDLSVPIQKGTSGVVVLSREYVDTNPKMACVRCGKCLEACPMGLMPNMIGIYGERGRYDDAEKYNVMDCFECGACAYVCPSKRPMVEWVRQSKQAINDKRRRQREAKA
jgi:Na+-translocating ferredoxin:NAD+ oxidoreductase subunit C